MRTSFRTAVDPRWQYQSAFVPTVPDDAEGELELPEMRLRHRSQSLAGVIADPDGRPVAGATVASPTRESRGNGGRWASFSATARR